LRSSRTGGWVVGCLAANYQLDRITAEPTIGVGDRLSNSRRNVRVEVRGSDEPADGNEVGASRSRRSCVATNGRSLAACTSSRWAAAVMVKLLPSVDQDVLRIAHAVVPLFHALRNQFGQVQQTAGIAPFVVVPAEDFDDVAVRLGERCVEAAGRGVAAGPEQRDRAEPSPRSLCHRP
jgi:hypothetical protein